MILLEHYIEATAQDFKLPIEFEQFDNELVVNRKGLSILKGMSSAALDNVKSSTNFTTTTTYK